MGGLLNTEADLATKDLFSRVLGDALGEDAFLGALVALHNRPTQMVVDRSAALLVSADANERCVGLRVLRELGQPSGGSNLWWVAIEPDVIRLAITDDDSDVVRWAISCLEYLTRCPEALAAVLGQAGHADDLVGFAVASALPSLAGENDPDPAAVNALIDLAGDPAADVRSYALMGLVGDLGLVDEIRETLQAHAADPDDQIREYCERVLSGDQEA